MNETDPYPIPPIEELKRRIPVMQFRYLLAEDRYAYYCQLQERLSPVGSLDIDVSELCGQAWVDTIEGRGDLHPYPLVGTPIEWLRRVNHPEVLAAIVKEDHARYKAMAPLFREHPNLLQTDYEVVVGNPSYPDTLCRYLLLNMSLTKQGKALLQLRGNYSLSIGSQYHTNDPDSHLAFSTGGIPISARRKIPDLTLAPPDLEMPIEKSQAFWVVEISANKLREAYQQSQSAIDQL